MRVVDILTLGNALIDLLVNLPDESTFCRIDSVTGELCIKAGEKIPAEHVGFSIGGGACRVAIGMKRLGLASALCAEIGNDELAGRIKRVLTEEGVSTEHLVQVPQVTSFTVGLNFQKDRTLFTHHAHAAHAFDLSDVMPSWIYIASLSAPWENAYQKVFTKKEQGVKIAWNPGLLQLTEGVEYAKKLLKDTEVLFVNKQEAQLLLATKETDIASLLLQIADLGGSIVVITNGKEGAYAIDKQRKRFFVGTLNGQVVERTGAGDAFATGFLAAIMQGKKVDEAMVWGVCNASSVVSEYGGVSGLLTQEKMKEMVDQKSQEIQVKDIS